jgi:hypothetical protein
LASAFGDIEDTLKQGFRLAKVAVEDSLTATFAQESATFALALAAPHTVIDVIVERVDKTLTRYGAGRADFLGDDDARSVTGEEGLCGVLTALPIGHPL